MLRFLFALHAAGPAPDTRAYLRAQRKALPKRTAESDLNQALPHSQALHPDFQMAEALTSAERRTQKRQLRAQRRLRGPVDTAPALPELDNTAAETWTSQKPIDPAEMDSIARMFVAPAPSGEAKTANPLGIVPAPGAEKPGKDGTAKTRTGRPRRMRFSQGDAHDLDAIDE